MGMARAMQDPDRAEMGAFETDPTSSRSCERGAEPRSDDAVRPPAGWTPFADAWRRDIAWGM
jgi:hypothetical protein